MYGIGVHRIGAVLTRGSMGRHLLAASMLAISMLPNMANAQRYDERPETLQPVFHTDADFTRRTVDIPMRDGVKLHTVSSTQVGALRWHLADPHTLRC